MIVVHTYTCIHLFRIESIDWSVDCRRRFSRHVLKGSPVIFSTENFPQFPKITRERKEELIKIQSGIAWCKISEIQISHFLQNLTYDWSSRWFLVLSYLIISLFFSKSDIEGKLDLTLLNLKKGVELIRFAKKNLVSFDFSIEFGTRK